MKWEWWDDINTTRLWLTILLSVSHEPKRWRGMEIDSGEMITSYSQLAKKSGLSVKNVRTALKHLKETNEVTCRPASKAANSYTVIKVVKWGDYQHHDAQTGKRTGKQSGTRTGNETATNKNIKNKRSKENIYTTHFRFTPPDYIIQQINGTLPDETPASAEEIDAIKQLQEKMKC